LDVGSATWQKKKNQTIILGFLLQIYS